jgi:hypothetical protein
VLPGVLMAIPVILGDPKAAEAVFDRPLLILVAFVGLIVVHEAIHALAWKMASGLGWSSFKFGVLWKVLTPYAHATSPMNARAYRIGCVAPFFALGVAPWLMGLALGSATLGLFGVMGALAGAGDLLIIWLIRKVSAGALVADHPSDLGCVLVESAP